MKIKLLSLLLSSLLLLPALAGCSEKDVSDDPAVSTDGTASGTVHPENIGTSAPIKDQLAHDPEEDAKKEQVREIYKASAEDSVWIAEEKSAKEIVYTGFDYKYFNTPALSDNVPFVSATPLFSHSGIHDYIEEKSKTFDLGDEEDSFTAVGERYMESFFIDKGIIVISFTDSEGGGSYTLTGAWKEHIHSEDFHMDNLVFALKKTPGENKHGHLIIELEDEFLSTWDGFSVSIYE